jgi:hypothetical protein
MLLTPSGAEERIFQFVRQAGELRATPEDVARSIDCAVEDARHALDDLVQRNMLRRFDVPGQGPIYWD